MHRLFLLATLALLGGCADVAFVDPLRQGPFFAPTNQAGEPSLGGLRRVVVLPVYCGALAPAETAAAFDPVFVAALQHENRFEVVTLPREECLRKFDRSSRRDGILCDIRRVPGRYRIFCNSP